MRQSLRLILIYVFIFSLHSGTGWSQVVVEKSKDKVVISGKPYYVHIVKKGETAYSISRAYGIKVEELTNENPTILYGVKEGQSLKIPVTDNKQAPAKNEQILQTSARDEVKFIYHKLSPGETIYSLSKKYDVSENEIVLSNVGIDINKLPVGSEIAIPRVKFMSDQQKFDSQGMNYIYHKVAKGETLYSIAEQHGTTVRELRRQNRGLLFPKVDDNIRIPIAKTIETPVIEEVKTDTVRIVSEEPVIQAERPVGFTPVGNLKGSYNVALLLPLYLQENAQRIEIDSSQTIKGKKNHKVIPIDEQWIYPPSIPFLELYEGVLIAADTLRSRGLDIILHVYDIRSDTVEVTHLIEAGALKEMDLIIGPVYSRNLSIVAAYAGNYDIPVVSPVPLRTNSSLENNPVLFMADPSLDVAQETIAKKVSEYYDYNFVFIHSDSAHTNPEINSFKNKIFRELSSKLPYDEIKFKEFIFYSRSAFNNDSVNRLEHALSDQSKNLVIIASEEPPVMSESISDLVTLSKKFDITLFGYPAMRNLENLDAEYYFNLEIELFSPYWIDYNDRNVKNFNSSFRHKFLTEPSETSFAWQGYDITYFFLSGLAIHGKRFISNPEIHNPDLLQMTFDFKRKGRGNGFENQKLFLIKYTKDMDIKVLDINNINLVRTSR
jgi:LysM repeat protein/ABC-type branched-subunit amino acid transport system substrate-binding protein